MSNLAHNETITLKEKRKNYGTMNIRSYVERLGFTGIDTEELTYETDIKVRYYIGYKSIDYYSKKRGVTRIFLNTNESIETYKKLAVDIDYLKDNSLYDQIARDIYSKKRPDKIHALETEYGLDYCYWVTGKGLAGGIASEVATVIRKEDSEFKRLNNWYTIKDIYCYTFGAPKTHIGASYQHNFIKNIINEDDFLTKVIPDDKGYRNGFTYNASVYSELKYNYKNLTRNNPKYTGNYMQMNTVKNAYIKLRDEHPSVMDNVNIDMSKLLSKNISGTSNEEDMKWTKNYVNTSDLATEIINQVSNNELKSAASVKAYWTLAKCLEGLNEKTINQRNYNKTVETSNSEIWSYIAFPCYQKKEGIPINNEVPMYFQTNERWSRFIYGRRKNYTDNEGDDNRVMSRSSGYSYSTFYEAGCGPSSVAMVLSYLYKKYITPMDVRNRLEDNKVFCRDDKNGGSGTIHAVLTASVSEVFNVNCQYGEMPRTNANVKRVLKALIEGNPVVAVCHGENSSEYPNNSSHFTKTGHYIVLAGVNKDDMQILIWIILIGGQIIN